MSHDALYELIQKMREKQRIFAEFAKFVDFHLDTTRTVFKDSLIEAYAHFLDALDAAIDDFNGAENSNPKLLYCREEKGPPTVIHNGQLAPRVYCFHRFEKVVACFYRCAECGNIYELDETGKYTPWKSH